MVILIKYPTLKWHLLAKGLIKQILNLLGWDSLVIRNRIWPWLRSATGSLLKSNRITSREGSGLGIKLSKNDCTNICMFCPKSPSYNVMLTGLCGEVGGSVFFPLEHGWIFKEFPPRAQPEWPHRTCEARLLKRQGFCVDLFRGVDLWIPELPRKKSGHHPKVTMLDKPFKILRDAQGTHLFWSPAVPVFPARRQTCEQAFKPCLQATPGKNE